MKDFSLNFFCDGFSLEIWFLIRVAKTVNRYDVGDSFFIQETG